MKRAWPAVALVLAGCQSAAESPDQDLGPAGAGVPVEAGVSVDATDGDSLVGEDGTLYRLIGVNAPDDPECLAAEARTRLAQLVQGPVAVQGGTENVDQFGRRLVEVLRDTAPRFVNQAMVREGLAIAVHSEGADVVFSAQQLAQEDQIGLWDPQRCGTGPMPAIEIVEVSVNPAGPDDEVLDDEYVVLGNSGSRPLTLTGWMIRDESTQNRYTFPSGFVLGAGEEVTVTSGEGEFGFAMGSPVWNNAGDTVIVVDDQDRFVAYLTVTG